VHINTRFGAEPGSNRRAISHADLLSLVPDVIEHWGKFQIANDRDTIHTAKGVTLRADARDATFVRVSSLPVLAFTVHFRRIPDRACLTSTFRGWIASPTAPAPFQSSRAEYFMADS
jgi:hypothetical protein